MRLVKWFLLAGLFLLVPAPAKAWGPAAHLDFGLIVLKDLALLAWGQPVQLLPEIVSLSHIAYLLKFLTRYNPFECNELDVGHGRDVGRRALEALNGVVVCPHPKGLRTSLLECHEDAQLV